MLSSIVERERRRKSAKGGALASERVSERNETTSEGALVEAELRC